MEVMHKKPAGQTTNQYKTEVLTPQLEQTSPRGLAELRLTKTLQPS